MLVRKKLSFWCLYTAMAASACAGAGLSALPEHLRPDPFGAIVAPDRISGAAPTQAVKLESARAAYVSLQLVVSLPEGGDYRLEVQPFAAASGIQADLFREWFHYLPKEKLYLPDALVPVRSPYASRLPEPDNRIEKQTAQAFWLDLWVPAATRPGDYRTTATLRAAGRTYTLPVQLRVLAATVPDKDVVAMDHNSYGTSWYFSQYPELARRLGAGFGSSDAFYELIHAYHRVFYEHRGVYHQLGYGHGGKVGPEFAPQLTGEGKNKRIADWTAYDRHYGPLLDGSAFASTRRGARPIPYVYLPINPEWPASQLWWGEPGYEREFVNVVSAMERHFREKGWTNTRFEMFFNQKKRYMGFEWDGDETRFARDFPYLHEYARLLKLAVPAASPVKFAYRADVSWLMERQFKEFAGELNFWVCNGDMFAWYPEAVPALKARGDVVWLYGGTPPVTRPVADVAIDVLRTWIFGVDGFVRWQTTDPGVDPWFQFAGGSETLVYPGDRFGIAAPIPSIRLKVERNVVQDLTLFASAGAAQPVDSLRARAARLFNNTSPGDWRAPRPALADHDPLEWSITALDEALAKSPKLANGVDAASWQRVREAIFTMAREAK
jgi:hypothetical protein